MKAAVAAILSLFATLLVASGEPTQKPNLIFIFSDDVAMGDLGAYGQKRIQTPHSDLVAKAVDMMSQARTPHELWPDPAQAAQKKNKTK